MPQKFILFFIIALIACLTQLASDIYAPCLNVIAQEFKVNIPVIQNSMAVYMLGVGFSQLIYGPLSEVWGRKKPLLLGMSIMLLGSLLAAYAPNIKILFLARLLQGLGAGSAAALWRSTFRDLFTGIDLAKYSSYIGIFIMFVVPAAPLVGSYLQHYYNWRSIFFFMLGYAALGMIALHYGFKETSKHHHRDNLKLSYMLSSFKQLLTNPLFMGVTSCTFICYGVLFSWLMIMPVLLIERLGLSSIAFGQITFLIAATSFGSAAYLNKKLLPHWGMVKILRAGLLIMLLAGLILLTSSYIYGLNLVSILVSMSIFYLGSTLIWPNAFALAFTPFGHIAGYAGACYGFLQVSGAALLGGLSAYLPSTGTKPLSMLTVVAILLTILIFSKTAPKVSTA